MHARVNYSYFKLILATLKFSNTRHKVRCIVNLLYVEFRNCYYSNIDVTFSLVFVSHCLPFSYGKFSAAQFGLCSGWDFT